MVQGEDSVGMSGAMGGARSTRDRATNLTKTDSKQRQSEEAILYDTK